VFPLPGFDSAHDCGGAKQLFLSGMPESAKGEAEGASEERFERETLAAVAVTARTVHGRETCIPLCTWLQFGRGRTGRSMLRPYEEKVIQRHR